MQNTAKEMGLFYNAQGWVSECPDVKNYKWQLNPVWHRMLYSCTYMATVGVKGLIIPEQIHLDLLDVK